MAIDTRIEEVIQKAFTQETVSQNIIFWWVLFEGKLFNLKQERNKGDTTPWKGNGGSQQRSALAEILNGALQNIS